jgi:CBS domain-containing protein
VSTPPLIVEATIHFLKAHLPFSRMARRDLEFIAERARLAYFPVGSTIVDPAGGIAEYLHIIQRGHVRVRNPNAAVDDVRGVGECFPVAALAAARHAHFRGHRGRLFAAAAAGRFRCAA